MVEPALLDCELLLKLFSVQKSVLEAPLKRLKRKLVADLNRQRRLMRFPQVLRVDFESEAPGAMTDEERAKLVELQWLLQTNQKVEKQTDRSGV